MGAAAVFPVFTAASYQLFQQTLAPGTASARAWGLGVFPTLAAPAPPAPASTTLAATGRVGYLASAAAAGGMAGAHSTGTGYVTLWWVEAGVLGVYRSSQAGGGLWSGPQPAFTWSPGSVAGDATLLAVAFDTGSGLLFAAGATTLHVSCAAPDTATPCAFAVGAALEGALQFRGLAMSPSGCGGLRRALRQEGGSGSGSGSAPQLAAAAAAARGNASAPLLW